MIFPCIFYVLKLKYCSLFTLGRLHHSAKMYGEVFVNGAKSHMPYGSYVSPLLHLLLGFHFFGLVFSLHPCCYSLMYAFNLSPTATLIIGQYKNSSPDFIWHIEFRSTSLI